MFRRKADSLPTFVSHESPYFDEPEDDKKLKKPIAISSTTKWSLGSYSCLFYSIVLFCCIFYLIQKKDSVEFGSFLSSDFDDVMEENETLDTVVDEIMKRHPYVTVTNGGNEDLKHSSTILKKHQRPRTEQDNYGNIVIFSLHGQVGSESLMNSLHQQYGFQDGGHLYLDDIHNSKEGEGEGQVGDEDEWGIHDATVNSELWQENIVARLERTFQGYGSRDFRRKVVEVRMSDAWTNDVSITWLIEALRDVGGVTHMVLLMRNPLRAKISDIARTRYKHIITPSVKCHEQTYLYDVGRSEAIEMAVAQHSGFREALSVGGIEAIGLTYEHDILPDHMSSLKRIANFLWDPGSGLLPDPVEVNPSSYFTVLGECELNRMIYNFKELNCLLSNTGLKWMVNSDESYNFGDIMELGDQFKNWVSEQRGGLKTQKLMNPLLCRVVADHQDVENAALAVRKHSRRCGHGGHSPVCAGYGPMKSFMCSRLLALSNGQCDSFTYTNGNCYLHDETASDFWEGDCESSTIAFLGYLRFPDDR